MRQRQHFDRQRRLTMATYDHDLQQRSSVIPVTLLKRFSNPSTTKHRDSHNRSDEARVEPREYRGKKHSSSTPRRKHHEAAIQSSFAPSDLSQSSRGCIGIAAQGFDLGVSDYNILREACLELLTSPTFDLIGEPFHLQHARLLDHKSTPSNPIVNRKRSIGANISEQHEDARSEHSFNADGKEEDEEDEPLQVPAKHQALWQEWRRKRGQIYVAEDVHMDRCLTGQALNSNCPSHAIGITSERDQDNTLQIAELISKRAQAPEYVMTERSESITTQHDLNKLGQTQQASVSLLMHHHAVTAHSVDPEAAIPTSLGSSPVSGTYSAESSKLIVKSTVAAADTSVQTVTPPPSFQFLSATHHTSSSVQEKDTITLKPHNPNDFLANPDLSCTEVLATAPQPLEPDSAVKVVDETSPQPAIAPQLARLQPPATMTLSCHAAITELALRSTGPKGELQRIESPIPPSTSVPRSEEFSTFANGFVGLLERRKGDNPEPVDVQEAEHQPIHMYSQSNPSERDIQLHSDEETPYQGNMYNNNNNNNKSSSSSNNNNSTNDTNNIRVTASTHNRNNTDEDYVNNDDISPIVSTQHSFSRQSSFLSATPDWPPANQEDAARRLALLQNSHFAASTSASSHSGYGHLQWLGSEVPQMTRPIDHEYNFGFDLTTSSSFQQLSPKRLHASLTRPPSDPKDTDALNPILDNQEPFRFGFEFESGLVKRVPSYGNSGGEAMRRIECAFDLDMNLSANGESSEWIGSEEWELLDNVHVN